MSDESATEDAAQEKPDRRCITCDTMIPASEILERERAGKPFLGHRISVRNGNLIESKICGPLVTNLIFHVYAKHQEPGKAEQTFRTLVTANRPPEEDWMILQAWETYLERERTPRGEDGEPLHDAPRVTVVVERWHLVAAK
jgi:hypothetical protein